jgi:hypothetical protein
MQESIADISSTHAQIVVNSSEQTKANIVNRHHTRKHIGLGRIGEVASGHASSFPSQIKLDIEYKM